MWGDYRRIPSMTRGYDILAVIEDMYIDLCEIRAVTTVDRFICDEGIIIIVIYNPAWPLLVPSRSGMGEKGTDHMAGLTDTTRRRLELSLETWKVKAGLGWLH